METKCLKENAVYSDAVSGGYILPLKEKYTMEDVKTLIKDGWSKIDARWIVLCSWVYHNTDIESGISAMEV